MTQRPETYSAAHRRRQREAHARSDGYGRHRHLYLHDTMRRLVGRIRQEQSDRPLSWLDYGCGKGGFIEQIRPLGLFTAITGYDPAVSAYQGWPEGRFDLVTCLHVLDVVEPRFLDATLDDIARLTGNQAVFDILTRPKPASGLRAHPPFYWTQLVRQHLDIVEANVEFPGMQDFERIVIIAAPRAAA